MDDETAVDHTGYRSTQFGGMDVAEDEADIETAPFLDEARDGVRQQKKSPWLCRTLIRFGKTVAILVVAVLFIIIIFSIFGTRSPIGPPTSIEVNDDFPLLPRLRPSSEYILSANGRPSAPLTRHYDWTITDGMLNPDGVYRPMMLINNQFPGPLVECYEGDTIVVEVHNRASNATALHFHGLLQNGTNSMDGTVGVTQCPIAPGASFTYRFTVNDQQGTYWYHAHHSAQSSDGLVGPMVVHHLEYDDESDSLASDRIVMIQEHYYNISSSLLMDYLQSDKENEEPVPFNGLVNGRGYRDCASLPGWNCSQSETMARSLENIEIEVGKRHRLRFIHTGAMAEFQVQIDDHPFFITEVDGTNVHPEQFETLNILPAQRYSVVLTANATSSPGGFWLRGRMVTHCFATKNPYLQSEVKAIVRYKDLHSHDETPVSTAMTDQVDVKCRDLNTTSLRPIKAIPAPRATTDMFLRANFEIGDWRLSRGFFNASSWKMNVTSPTLYRYLDLNTSSTSGIDVEDTSINSDIFDPSEEFIYQTRGIQVVDVVISNFDDGAHPFHLHGHKFFVLKQSPKGYPPATMEELESELQETGVLDNPLRRDTMTVDGYGWAVLRVVLDNPGMWAFHCHNTWHGEAGMMMVFASRVDDLALWDRGDLGRGLCSLPGVEMGMRVGDDYWEGNFGRT